MKILTIVGKIDSRPFVYPLAKALSLNGLTGIVTDDGAYRRLYHGIEDVGTVAGIDIGVCQHVNEKNVHILDETGLQYENLIIVSSDYISPESTGLIICHGVDRSILGTGKEEEDDDFLLPFEIEAANKEEASVDESKKSSKKAKLAKKDNTGEETDAANEDNKESENEVAEPVIKEETPQERRMRLQEENPDIIIVPDNIPFAEVQISYSTVPKKEHIAGILLKDGLIAYVYKCEEQKRIDVLPNKDIVNTIAKVCANPLGMDQKELVTLLSREEGTGALEKGGKK